ncbi:hypothetical protein ACVWY3_004184 [Bradyrhizobium sp. USDA 4486]
MTPSSLMPPDSDNLVLDLHFNRDLAQPIFVFTELFRDLGDGGDVMDLDARGVPLDRRLLMPASNLGQELAQLMSWDCRDASKDIGQPACASTPFILTRDDQAVRGCGAPPAAISFAEQPGFSSKDDASQAPFGPWTGTHVLKERREASDIPSGIVEDFGQVVCTGEVDHLLPHIEIKCSTTVASSDALRRSWH